MSLRNILPGFLLLSLLLSGCGSSAVTPIIPKPAQLTPNTEPTLTPVIPMATQVLSKLGLGAIKNMTCNLPASQRAITFVNGRYSDKSTNNPLEAAVSDFYAFGDVNGDGLDDAAVVVWENTGGSGVFESLILVLNQNGVPVQAGSFSLGDRVKINNMAIDSSGEQKKILVDMLVQGPNDAQCCPTFPVIATFMVTKSGLQMTRLVSKTPDGSERAITIESPKDGEQVSGSVQVKGNVSIAPFENNLAYRIYDAAGKELAAGPFMIKADTMGGPGTFDNPVDLGTIPAGQVVRLELQDLSMADGSTLAMDSVELIVK
jgi:hypothetical protein